MAVGWDDNAQNQTKIKQRIEQMNLKNIKAITDICILVEDVETTIDFYTNKLGFEVRRRAESFVDFHAPGVILAAWELDHINQHTGINNARTPKGVNKTCIAVELSSGEELDATYLELKQRGVRFHAPPKKYPAWQAYCVYFHDPDDTLWELYYWYGDIAYSHLIFAKESEQQS